MASTIIQLGRTDTGYVINDFTWDFCKTYGGTNVATAGSTLVEYGAGVYELTNPNATARTFFSIYVTADSTLNVVGEFNSDINTEATKAIIHFGRTDTGHVIGDFTWDFCKTSGGTDVSTTGSTLIEYGVGVYEITNPQITERTAFGIYVTADSTLNTVGEFHAYDDETATPTPGYSTYLELVNKVLKRITQTELSSDVSSAIGHAKIIAELINEAQMELWMETTNWYTLYSTRTISTTADLATYALADDWGRTITLIDTTTGRVLTEDVLRAFDESDPDSDTTGTPTHFAIQGGNYRLYPIPDGTYSLRERYWKIPTPLSADDSTSSLPLFCESFLINWSLMGVLEYLNKFEQADRIKDKLYGKEGILQKCKIANKKVIDQTIRFESVERTGMLVPPRFPSHY